jgi:cell wall assembly regulator SMI1
VRLLEKINAAHEFISEHPDYEGGDLEVAPPATHDEVQRVEAQLGRALPDDLRRLYTEVSARLAFDWSLDSEEPLELDGEEIYYGGGDILDLTELPELVRIHSMWAERLTDWRPYFPVFGINNGDMLAVDMGSPAQSLVYLSHENNPGECVTDVFPYGCSEFFERWVDLYCVGPEGWILDCFLDDDRQLSVDSENARQWLEYLAETDGDEGEVDDDDEPG